ncbi:MAG: hypothetical protein B7O98_04625 [Zestosphaera tikiterensis]|uniref:DUF7619 domain-containing protein n=1 Tax=Zestosphaera tikiterensis TaxID=1973259 RepID=A0A2R7Y5F4_9CREN|nr:MAG: hypothetical protein B7O98_04625 [Zestosphaera tikiterensis]
MVRLIARSLSIIMVVLLVLPEANIIFAENTLLGPAFNSVQKIPVVKPSRDYLPANYSHALNLIFNFKTDQGLKRETGITTTLISDNTVRIHAYNYYTNYLAIADLDLVTLEKKVKYVFSQYYNETPHMYGPIIRINGTAYNFIEQMTNYGVPAGILGSTDVGANTIVVTRVMGFDLPPIELKIGRDDTARRDKGYIVIASLNKNSADTYILDLGAVVDRALGGPGIINSIPFDVRALNSASIRFNGSTMSLALTSLGWPGAPVYQGWIDYVDGLARIGERINNTHVKLFAGTIIAQIDLGDMKVINASFVYSKEYNSFSIGKPLSDGGFLVLLVSVNSVVFVKVGKELRIEWVTRIDLPAINPDNPGWFINHFKIAEAGNGYVALLPFNLVQKGWPREKPVVVYLDKSGRLKWSAQLQPVTWVHTDIAELSADNDTIYVVWSSNYDNPPGKLSWITMFDESGEVLGSFRNAVGIEYNAGLFTEVHGRLGRDRTIICRPTGYHIFHRGGFEGWIDAMYLLNDYDTMELGENSPFRDFRSNDADLEKGEGWIVSSNPTWLNVSYGYTGVGIAYYKHPILVKSGESITINNTYVDTPQIVTVLRDVESTVEFTPSFVYPVAIMPDEIDFGQVHIGEEKAVDVEVVWLSDMSGTARGYIYHIPKAPFKLGDLFKVEDAHVGNHVRVRMYFKPDKEGIATDIFGLGAMIYPGVGYPDPSRLDYPRQTIPVRGIGVSRDKPIVINISNCPVSLGLSASYISMPPFILPGSSYRESIYITNIGNAEAVFIHGILVLPGSTVISVKGADEVIGLGNESLDPFFAIATKLKPLETRRIDIYMRITAELADRNSPYRKLGLERAPHGAVPMEIAALPPALWEEAWSYYKKSDKPHLVVDAALRMYNDYVAGIVMKLGEMPEDELNDALVNLWMSNQYLADYLDIVSFRMAMGDWMFNETAASIIIGANGEVLNASGIKVNNTTSMPRSSVLRLESILPGMVGVQAESDEPGLIWYLRELFKPKEFLETAGQGLIGLGEGAIQALTFDLVKIDAKNEYQAVGKTIGYIATNVEMLVANAASISKSLPGLLPGLKSAVTNLATAGVNTVKVVGSGLVTGFKSWRLSKMLGGVGPALLMKLFKVESTIPVNIPILKKTIEIPWELSFLENYKTLLGFEYLIPTEGKTVYGNIIKLAENKNFGGWYIGIGYTLNKVIEVDGKLVYPGWWHYYLKSGKLVVYNPEIKGYTEELLPILQPLLGAMKDLAITAYRNPAVTYLTTGLAHNAYSLLWGDMYNLLQLSYGDTLSRVSFSADPNELHIRPSPYVGSLDSDIYIQTRFENLANATAPAYNITVRVYLEGPVNASTITVWDASHPEAFDGYRVSVDDGRVVVEVRFTNITLPPNKNPPEGEGWVTLKLRFLGDARPGDSIRAYADVYFDYNPPVRTNTESTTYDPDPPEVSINASVEPGKIRVSLTCLDSVSGCNYTVLMLRKGVNPLANETLLEPGPGGVYEVSLEPGTYTLVAIGIDNAGNRVWSNTTINVPGITTNTPWGNTTTINVPGTTSATNESESRGGGSGIPIWIYLAIPLVAVAAVILVVKLRRPKS